MASHFKGESNDDEGTNEWNDTSFHRASNMIVTEWYTMRCWLHISFHLMTSHYTLPPSLLPEGDYKRALDRYIYYVHHIGKLPSSVDRIILAISPFSPIACSLVYLIDRLVLMISSRANFLTDDILFRMKFMIFLFLIALASAADNCCKSDITTGPSRSLFMPSLQSCPAKTTFICR